MKKERIKDRIIKVAERILKDHPRGVRFMELYKMTAQSLPDENLNTIYTQISVLGKSPSENIYKPARGLFQHVVFKDKTICEDQGSHQAAQQVKEEDFYESFAEWLVNESEDCTNAIPLGGNKFKGKWGTPDVIGKRESSRSDILKAPTEIVSAEIKADSTALITAFGQACSYMLFSHKCYIVVPKQSPPEDMSRLDSLCLIFGIGLVLFDNTKREDPRFEIRVRPSKREPDMFYLNKFMKLVEKELFPL